MGNLSALITIPLTVIFVPLLLGKMPYFRRPDVVARRAAKAQLPGWVTLVETIFFGVSAGVLVVFFFWIEEHAHRALHQGKNVLSSAPSASSVGFIFWLIQILAPVIMALPLAMLLANFVSWLILPIRNLENKIVTGGVRGYSWHDLNFGLIKFSLMALPVCIVLTTISLIQI
jgi:hypothetical protein